MMTLINKIKIPTRINKLRYLKMIRINRFKLNRFSINRVSKINHHNLAIYLCNKLNHQKIIKISKIKSNKKLSKI